MSKLSIKYKVENLVPGMVLGKDVQSASGAILLPARTVLSDYSISKLRDWSVEVVQIFVSDDTFIPQQQEVENETPADMAFFDMYTQAVDDIGAMFEQIRLGGTIPMEDCNLIAQRIMEQSIGNQGVLTRLRRVKRGDNYTYNHSLNVGIYAVLLGTWLGYNEQTLRNLAIAGLLHDIGKAKILSSILNKPGPLTREEFDEIKKHPVYGYQMIEKIAGVSKDVIMSIAQHHERENGSGYPLGLKANSIHPCAKVIAVADVYDAVTSDRVFQSKNTPYVAVDIILKESFNTLSPEVVRRFVQNVAVYFHNDRLRLNNGVEGTVVHIDQQNPTRPLLHTDQGVVDLREYPELHITEML